jgi:hypothetical protein
MAGKKKVPERRSGLRPSEKELPERLSGAFRHKKYLALSLSLYIYIFFFFSRITLLHVA